MSSEPLELTLELTPRARLDVVDLRSRFAEEHRDALAPFPRCLYWSFHTTAGYLDRSFAARLNRDHGIDGYLHAFRAIFPEKAGYQHDELDRRHDLDPDQRKVEPRNGDSHLAYIAAGLRACVTYPNRADEPVCFVDLDGVNAGQPRRRQTRVIGYHVEEEVARVRVEVPVSAHPLDSVNLKDRRFGIYPQLRELVTQYGIERGRVRLALAEGQRHAGLTINEYETLLMQHDLFEVLRDPLRFAAQTGRNILADPRTVPAKTLGYAKYDFVRVLNQTFDLLGLRDSRIERAIARVLALPAARFFRMRRTVSLLVSAEQGEPRFVEGAYQSPILVQWQSPPRGTRLLDVSLTRLR